MASEEIGDLSAATALTGSEIVHVVQGGESLRTTTAAIGALAPAFRNLIINGDMRVNQEGDKAGVGLGSYGCDLNTLNVGGAALYDLTQTADGPPGFARCLEIKVATADASIAAGDYTNLVHKMEGQNLQHACKGLSSAKPFQLQIWTKTNKAGTYPVELYDNDNTRHVLGSMTCVGTGTWEQAALTFPADTTGAFDNDMNPSLQLVIWLSAGTAFASGTAALAWAASVSANRAADLSVNFADTIGNYMRITGVQLEVGDTATEFEHLPYDVQLQRVQRYYEQWPANHAYMHYVIGSYDSTTSAQFMLNFSEKRASPTCDFSGTAQVLAAGTSSSSSSITFSTVSPRSARMDVASLGTSTAGFACILRASNDINVYIDFNARL